MSSTFVAFKYDDELKAQEVRLAMVKLQREYDGMLMFGWIFRGSS